MSEIDIRDYEIYISDDEDVIEELPIDDNKAMVESMVESMGMSSHSIMCQKCKIYPVMTEVCNQRIIPNEHYFESYSHYSIHEEMIKDSVRTQTYRNAIFCNKHLFKNKVVLDIGCGTGILCLFAAKAGAQHVFGIECSGIVRLAQQIVFDNNLTRKITLIKGKVEEVELPEEYPKVDIIVSEWMGYSLFTESMLETVIYARNKWMKRGGLIFPDRATLFISAVEDQKFIEKNFDWFNDVYGFDMSRIKKYSIEEPMVKVVDNNKVVTDCNIIKEVNLYTVEANDLTFSSDFRLRVNRNDYINAFITYFKIDFTKCDENRSFSTSPDSDYTHWKQTVFYFEKYLTVRKGEYITGCFKMSPNKRKKRDMDFQIEVDFKGSMCSLQNTSSYRMHC